MEIGDASSGMTDVKDSLDAARATNGGSRPAAAATPAGCGDGGSAVETAAAVDQPPTVASAGRDTKARLAIARRARWIRLAKISGENAEYDAARWPVHRENISVERGTGCRRSWWSAPPIQSCRKSINPGDVP
jgi:hypothetical protein